MNTVSVIQSLTVQAGTYVVILNFAIATFDLIIWLIKELSHNEDSYIDVLFQKHKHYLTITAQAICLLSLFVKTICPVLVLGNEFILWTVMAIQSTHLYVAAEQAYGSSLGKLFTIIIGVCFLLICFGTALLLPNVI